METLIKLFNSQQFETAKKRAEHLIEQQPTADVYNIMGAIYLSTNTDRDKAVSYFKKAISLNPSDINSYNYLATTFKAEGNSNKALDTYKKCIETNPNLAEAYNNMGTLLNDLNRFNDAIESFNKAIELKPEYAEAYYNLGNVLYDIGQHEKAVTSYKKSIALKPDYAEAYSNLGNSLNNIGQHDKAIEKYKKAIEIKPDYANAYNNLGTALNYSGQTDEAIHIYKKAIELKLDYAEAYNNLGNVLSNIGQLDEAIENYKKAIKLKPDYAEAYFNLSITQLIIFNFQDAWANYKYRYHKNHNESYQYYLPITDKPAYTGQNEINNETLYTYLEQGHGDIIMFSRFFSRLENTGAQIILYLKQQPALLSLFQSNFPNIKIVTTPYSGEYDYHMPFMDIAGIFNINNTNMPSTDHYLSANKSLSTKYKQLYFDTTIKKVGLVWKAGAKKDNLKYRSISLTQLLKQLDLNSKCQFYSLQKEISDDERKLLTENNITEIGSASADFLDTASMLDNLDLLITVDTAAAHLSAALGKKTWILLPKACDWRWGIEGNSSYWYDHARLFRQKELNQWDEVFNEVNKELRFLESS